MRVAVFTNQFPAPVSTFFARDMRGLIEAGLEIDVFPIYPLESDFWRYIPEILNERVLPRTRIHHLGTAAMLKSVRPWPAGKARRFLKESVAIARSSLRFGRQPVFKTAYVCLKAWALAQKFKEPYDHILAYWGSYAGTCAYVFQQLTNPKTPFSTLLHAGDLYQDQVFLKEKLLRASKIFVVCEFNRRFIAEHFPDIYGAVADRISVYHPSLDFSEFPYDPSPVRNGGVLAVGRFDKCKGFDYLLKSVGMLAESGVQARVDLIGEGEEAESLKAIVEQLGLRDRVRFRGWLPFAEVKEAMNRATVLVHPSSELGDAVPTVIKEALASGTPVIGTTVAGIPELLDGGKCGVLVPPQDVQALAGAIGTLLANPELRRGYAVNGRAYAEEKFDLWRNGQRLAQALGSTR